MLQPSVEQQNCHCPCRRVPSFCGTHPPTPCKANGHHSDSSSGGYALWGMHRDLHEVKGGLWQHRWTRSLQTTQHNVQFCLGTGIIWGGGGILSN